jgi:hypothetical protein
MAIHICRYWNRPASYRAPVLGYYHDRMRMHVHCFVCLYMGTLHMGRHWRNLPTENAGQTGVSRDSVQLAR